MKNAPYTSLFLALMLTLSLALPMMAGAHEDKTSIVPASLVLKAGDTIQVAVHGLTDTDKATFELKGMFGSNDLGTYPITTDDFDQALTIPADLEPGSYSLIVTGGDKKAKVTVTVK